MQRKGDKVYMTIGEAMDELGCTYQNIMHLLRTDQLTRYKRGMRTLVKREEIESRTKIVRAG